MKYFNIDNIKFNYDLEFKNNSNSSFWKQNTPLIEYCETLGINIPHYCYHKNLSISGNCRMCLVELKNSPKPIVSCAMTAKSCLTNGDVYTNSSLVKKARENVLEFLLLNHPLDCPICDQGGECDLQDQSLVYGGDRGRFKEFKRATEDKNCGPLIKTIMTRCIHCTRCVRFANEVAGVFGLGTSGRGNSIEISTYIDKLFVSELSGNVIDLCPVGALTSKPYAFLSRPWELKSTESIDVFDSIHSNIRIDTRGYEIMRVLPRLNESINEEWISDKVRFAFDGFANQRLINPLLKTSEGDFNPITWTEAIHILIKKLTLSKPNKVAFCAGSFCDLESLFFIKNLRSACNGAMVNQFSENLQDSDFSISYKFNVLLKNILKADTCLLVGINPRVDGVLLNYHLRKRFLLGNFKLAYIGSYLNLTFPSHHLGNSFDKFISIVEGRNSFCKYLRNSKWPMIVIGSSFLNDIREFNFNLFSNSLRSNVKLLTSTWSGLSFFNTKSNAFSFYDLSLNYNYNYVENSFDLLYIIEDSVQISPSYKSKFVVFQGHHGCVNAQNADLILPCLSFVEKTSRFANCEGRYQYSQSCTLPLGQAKNSSSILSVILNGVSEKNKLSWHIEQLDFKCVLPSLDFSINKTIRNHLGIYNFFNKCLLVSNHYISSSMFDNFYKTDVISQSSLNMSKSSQELLEKTPFIN